MSDLYRDFIDQKADQIINSLGGTITPAVPNELYRDFLDRKFDDVINAVDGVKVKSFTYTGTGTQINDITFPVTPKIILGIRTVSANNTVASTEVFYNLDKSFCYRAQSNTQSYQNSPNYTVLVSYNGNVMTLDGGTAGRSFNTLDREYTVYYI